MLNDTETVTHRDKWDTWFEIKCAPIFSYYSLQLAHQADLKRTKKIRSNSPNPKFKLWIELEDKSIRQIFNWTSRFIKSFVCPVHPEGTLSNQFFNSRIKTFLKLARGPLYALNLLHIVDGKRVEGGVKLPVACHCSLSCIQFLLNKVCPINADELVTHQSRFIQNLFDTGPNTMAHIDPSIVFGPTFYLISVTSTRTPKTANSCFNIFEGFARSCTPRG